MGELLDNQVDTLNENLKKKFQGSRSLHKGCDEIKKVEEKTTAMQKKFLMQRGLYKAVSEDWLDRFQ